MTMRHDRKYAKNVTSVSSTVKSAMMGNEDFAMKDLLTSQDDLQLASRSFKFGLVPKVRKPPHYRQVRLALAQGCSIGWVRSARSSRRAWFMSSWPTMRSSTSSGRRP